MTFLQRQRSVASSLVLLGPWSLEDLEAEVHAMTLFLADAHAGSVKERTEDPATTPPQDVTQVELALLEDHQRFQESREQLAWYWTLFRQDPHPGNLQALGQYWKVLVDAALRHVGDEARYRSLLRNGDPRHPGDA